MKETSEQYLDYIIAGREFENKEINLSISRIDGCPVHDKNGVTYKTYYDYTTPEGDRLQSIFHAVNVARIYIDKWIKLKI